MHLTKLRLEGLVLLLIICVIGYLIECFMERCLEIVDSWWKVFCLVGLGYLFVFAMLRCMVGRRIVPYVSGIIHITDLNVH